MSNLELLFLSFPLVLAWYKLKVGYTELVGHRNLYDVLSTDKQ